MKPQGLLAYTSHLLCFLAINLILFMAGWLGLNSVAAQEPIPQSGAAGGIGSVGVEEAPTNIGAQAAGLSQGAITPTQIVGDGDAFVELNEAWQLSINLTNSGDVTATNISATLTTSTTGVSVVSATSAYPDLVATNSAANLTPFSFIVDPTAACGARINFTLTVTFNGGASPVSFNFPVQLGEPGTPITTSYTGPAVPIPDAADLSGTNPGAPVNASLPLSGISGNLFDLDFRFDGATCNTSAGSTTVGLDHTFVNDLRITLRSPQTTTVVIINNTDGSGNNFCQTLLDDESAGASIQSVVSANAPFTGSFRPNAPLSSFDGQNPNGTWQLQVQDFFSGDTGNIRAWSLIATPAICNAPVNADLALTKSASPNPVTAGGALTYTLSVINSGPGIASSSVVTDTLPPGMTFGGAFGSGWNCVQAGGNVTCTAATPIITAASIIITGTAPITPGLITNTATITSATSDPNSANDTDTVTTTVTALSTTTSTFLPITMNDFTNAPDLIVESLAASGNAVTVVIKNQGAGPVEDAFWVDVYLNPTTPPTQVNQRWQDVGAQGLIWGIQGAALPLDPGETLTLTIGDAYYFANQSNFSQPLAAGSAIYAQVDSVNLLTSYGGVLESHEISGGPYNNIHQAVATAGANLVTSGAETSPFSIVRLPPR